MSVSENIPWTLEGPFPQKSYWADMSFLSNLTLSTASQCVHWYWKPLIGPWEPVIMSWSKATWLLLCLIRRDRQRAWHLHCLIKRLTLALFLCRKWAVRPTGYRAWHWDETRWFMIAFNLKCSIPDRRCAILFCMLKKTKKKTVGFAFCSSGESNAFYKYKMAVCLGISQQLANI